MEMPETIFAVLIGIATLGALGVAMRAWGQGPAARRGGMGWLIFAASGAIQVLNLLAGYQLWLAILTTVGMGVGIWMGWATVRRA